MDLYSVFSRNLNWLMDAQGLRQSDLINLINKPSGTVNAWVNGQKIPRPETLSELAEILNVSPSYFFDEKAVNPRITKLAEELLRGKTPTAKTLSSINEDLNSENQKTLLKFALFLYENQRDV